MLPKGLHIRQENLPDFTKDDGQEISSLTISADGSWVVFVRGGDHGANWETGQPVNPAFDTEPFKVQVASIPFGGGAVKIFVRRGSACRLSRRKDRRLHKEQPGLDGANRWSHRGKECLYHPWECQFSQMVAG